jgi:putative FmdB family regulatory protein
MPLYDYACDQCGTQFEKQLSFRDDPAAVSCPHGHRKIHRVYAAPAVVFKGSGWYSTDHRSGKISGASDSGD